MASNDTIPWLTEPHHILLIFVTQTLVAITCYSIETDSLQTNKEVLQMAISWRTELEIGVPEIDEQHKHLVESFNVFLRACRDGKGSSELLRLLEFLDEYVINHFRAEETLQKKLSYPEHESHRLQHLGFVKRVQELKKQLSPEVPPEIDQVISTNNMMLDWLVKHISGSDKQFGRYLTESGYDTGN